MKKSLWISQWIPSWTQCPYEYRRCFYHGLHQQIVGLSKALDCDLLWLVQVVRLMKACEDGEALDCLDATREDRLWPSKADKLRSNYLVGSSLLNMLTKVTLVKSNRKANLFKRLPKEILHTRSTELESVWSGNGIRSRKESEVERNLNSKRNQKLKRNLQEDGKRGKSRPNPMF